MNVDILLYNGKIKTVDSKNNEYKRVGISENKIVLLDNNEGISDIIAKKSINLEGKLVLPGFIDTHLHTLEYAEQKTAVNLFTTTSVDEILDNCRKHLEKYGLYQGWLIGNGWNQNKFVDGRDMIYKGDLDKISTEFPIVVVRTCVHIAVVNSKALELILSSEDAKKLLDYIDVENGILKEGAITLYKKLLPKPNIEEIKKLILLGQEDYAKFGITSVHSADLFSAVPEENWQDLVTAYEELNNEKKLQVRTYEQCMFFKYEVFEKFANAGYRTGQGDNFFKIGPLKIITDGSLGARTAYMNESYADDKNTKGILILNEEKMREFLNKAKEIDMQVAVHTIGDGAGEMAVRLLNEKNNYINKNRDGIVHAQITTPEIFEQMKKGDITAYIQPVFIDSDMEIAEARVGYEKASTSYAWKTLMDMGLLISGGSDAPVVSFNVLENIFFAVTRKNTKCQPENGWFPQEKLSIDEAVRLFTINGARHSFEEDVKGSLEIGKLADLVVLEKDIYTIPENEIKDVNINMTILDGKIVYSV